MKDFLHNESCLEKYYACWQGSLISMVYFDKLTYFFGDNLVFVLHFNVIGNFDKCISHHTLTKFSSFQTKMWTPKHYCFFWAIFFNFSCEVRQISETNFKSSDSYNMFKQVNKTLKGFLNFFKTFMSGL